MQKNESLQGKFFPRLTQLELAGKVERWSGLPRGSIQQKSRNREVVNARDIFCFLATGDLKYSGIEVGVQLGITNSAVSHAARRGREIIFTMGVLGKEILG